MAQSQVNVRIDSRKVEVLEAAAFVDGKTLAEFVRTAVEGLADRLGDDAAIQLALQARDHRARRPRTNLTGFPTKHRPTGTGDA